MAIERMVGGVRFIILTNSMRFADAVFGMDDATGRHPADDSLFGATVLSS